MSRFLRHGALAGAVGGIGAALFLLLVGERSIADAIALEEASGHGGEETFSRSVQQFGGVLGAVIVGAAMGSVLGVVFGAVRHRLPGRDDFPRAVRLALVAYVTLFLVPFVKYPANPPAVGDPATVGRRTALYLVVLAWSVVATWLGWRFHNNLRSRGWDPALSGAVAVAAWA
ncbi:MAG TPA: CbtA family protein, partial [Acidimicrobiales bacterium]|nr:CbtA family protein [Acidimicrobiales bacterium]